MREEERRSSFVGLALCLVAALPVLGGAFSADVLDSPPAVSLSVPGGRLPAIAGGEASAFYVAGRTESPLVGPLERRSIDGGIELSGATSDGRPSSVCITAGPEGTVRVAFTVDGVGEFEKLGIRLEVDPSEGFYGLMERVVSGSQGLSWRPGMTEGLNLRGQTVDLYTLPTVSLYAPFFLSSFGYGIQVEGDWPSSYRFGVGPDRRARPAEVSIEAEGPSLSLLFLPGPTPLDVIERYARITGPPLLPPRFLFRPGRWRDEVWDFPAFYDGTPNDEQYNSMIVEDVRMMDALGIPCGWIVVDRPWAPGSFGYGGMAPDPARLPRFPEMVEWLNQRGIRTLLWIAPWVMDAEREEAIERSFDVPVSLPYLPNAALIDFTNPDAVAWWAERLRPLIETGIAGFKLDRGEEKPPDGQVFRGAYHDGTSYREGHNAYPLWFARAAAVAADRFARREFVSIYRAGWTGSSRYVAFWGGDTDPSAWGLRSAIIALQRAAVLNAPIWGSDTGGYNDRPSREVLGRWLAFSAFCPLMEVGPTANLAPWSWLPDPSEERLTAAGYTFDTVYDEELLAIWATYARLHDDLVDVTYALAEAAHERGTPIVRPMIVAHPDRPEFVDRWDQYYYGPDILVRPVWEPGIERVPVDLPEGRWVDPWSGRVHIGPKTVAVDVPLHVIPVFVRENSPVDIGSLAARWADAVRAVARQPDLASGVDR